MQKQHFCDSKNILIALRGSLRTKWPPCWCCYNTHKHRDIFVKGTHTLVLARNSKEVIMMLFALPLSGIIKMILMKDASHFNFTGLHLFLPPSQSPLQFLFFEIAGHLQAWLQLQAQLSALAQSRRNKIHTCLGTRTHFGTPLVLHKRAHTQACH